MQRTIGRDQGRDLPDPASFRLAQARDQASAHDRRLADAGGAHHGNQGRALDCLDQFLRERLPAAEEGSVFLTEGTQAAVGTDFRSEGGDTLHTRGAWRLPGNGRTKDLQCSFVRNVRRQIDPGIEREKTQRRIGARQQHRDDWEARLPLLAVKRQVLLPLLPGSKAIGAEENSDRLTGCQRPLQSLRPWLPRNEVPAIEEHAQAAPGQPAGDCFHCCVVAPVITKEYIKKDFATAHSLTIRDLLV